MFRHIVPLAIATLSVSACLAPRIARGQDEAPPRPDEEARRVDVDATVAALRSAPAEDLPRLAAQLAGAGPERYEAVRDARDATPQGPAREALARATRDLLVLRILETIRKGLESQLTYDGQYAELSEHGSEGVDALLAIIDDESIGFAYRVAACRAVADVAKSSVASRVRALTADTLLAPALREELGVLLAVFGDTHVLDRDLEEYAELARSERVDIRLAALVQLANLNYRIRRYEKAVRAYEDILSISRQIYDAQKGRLPAEIVRQLGAELAVRYYNAACSNTLFGDFERAKRYLEESIRLNPDHYDSLERDGDLLKLRQDPSWDEFRRRLGRLFEDEEL